MSAIGNQAVIHDSITAGKQQNARTLAIEATGDFFRGQITPKIRLAGRWLERAGFKPGHRVEVLTEQPGTLTLRFVTEFTATDTPRP
jgi:hypothetical protein